MKEMAENSTAVGGTASETCSSVPLDPRAEQRVRWTRMECWDMTDSHKKNPFADGDTCSLYETGVDGCWNHGGGTRFYAWRDTGGMCKLGTQARVRSLWMVDTRLDYKSEMKNEWEKGSASKGIND